MFCSSGCCIAFTIHILSDGCDGGAQNKVFTTALDVWYHRWTFISLYSPISLKHPKKLEFVG